MTSKFHLQLWKDPESSLDDPSRHSKLSRSSTRSFLLCQSDARFSQNARIKHTTSPYKIDHWHLRHNTHTTERKFTSLAVNKKKNFANLITHLFIYIRRYEWVNVSRQGQAKLKSGISNCPTNETGNRGNPSRNSHSQARSWNRPAARAASSTRASPPLDHPFPRRDRERMPSSLKGLGPILSGQSRSDSPDGGERITRQTVHACMHPARQTGNY